MKILLLVPVYNEEKRLNLDLFKDFHSACDLYFIDDGSTDRTAERLQSFINTHSKAKILKSQENQGKGNVLNWAYNILKSTGQLEKYDYIGYWDADLSVPFDGLQEMLRFIRQSDGKEAVFGSRRVSQATVIEQNLFRRLLSSTYGLLSRLILNHSLKDSKCGAKLFSKAAADVAFSGMFVNRWIFDLEIYYRLKKAEYLVLEFPLPRWRYVKESRLHFVDIPLAFLALFQLKIKYRKF